MLTRKAPTFSTEMAVQSGPEGPTVFSDQMAGAIDGGVHAHAQCWAFSSNRERTDRAARGTTARSHSFPANALTASG